MSDEFVDKQQEYFFLKEGVTEVDHRMFLQVHRFPNRTADEHLEIKAKYDDYFTLDINNAAPPLSRLKKMGAVSKVKTDKKSKNGKTISAWVAVWPIDKYNENQASWSRTHKQKNSKAASHRRIDDEVERATSLIKELFNCRLEVLKPCAQQLVVAICNAKVSDDYKPLKAITDQLIEKMKKANGSEYSNIIPLFDRSSEENKDLTNESKAA